MRRPEVGVEFDSLRRVEVGVGLRSWRSLERVDVVRSSRRTLLLVGAASIRIFVPLFGVGNGESRITGQGAFSRAPGDHRFLGHRASESLRAPSPAATRIDSVFQNDRLSL